MTTLSSIFTLASRSHIDSTRFFCKKKSMAWPNWQIQISPYQNLWIHLHRNCLKLMEARQSLSEVFFLHVYIVEFWDMLRLWLEQHWTYLHWIGFCIFANCFGVAALLTKWDSGAVALITQVALRTNWWQWLHRWSQIIACASKSIKFLTLFWLFIEVQDRERSSTPKPSWQCGALRC